MGLIKNNPYGLGLGNFEFGYIPYDGYDQHDGESNEKMIVKSPHNGYLELISELGIIAVIPLFIIIFYFLYILSIHAKSSQELLPFVLYLFFINQIFWTFPMEVPFTFAFFAALLGISLKAVSLKPLILNRSSTKTSHILLIIIISLLSFSFFFSNYIEYNYRNHIQLTSFGCDLFPSNWKICIRKGILEEKNGEYAKSINTLKKVINNMPNNFVAILQLAEANARRGQKEEACKYYLKYDELFDNNSSIKEHISVQCN